jgi:hypothetical protein
MRDAKVTDLKVRTLPLLTARLTRRELAAGFPVQLHPIDNPFELPEPCEAAVIQLDAGQYGLLTYVEVCQQLMLRVPVNANAPEFLSALFREVPLLRERLIWLRKDAWASRRAAGSRRA